MSDRPSKHGTNDRRVLGEGRNGMRINPPGFHGMGNQPDVPERCSRCGAELRGCAVDHPDGWLCAIDCGRPRDLPVKFSDTGLEAPS